MSVLGSIVRQFRQGLTGRRSWTPPEVRELLARREFEAARQASEGLSTIVPNREAERACLLGEISFQERNDAAAERHFAEALKLAPGMPAAHYGRSLLLSARGDFAAALRHVFFAQSCEPNEPRFLAQLGYCQLQLGNFALAEKPLRRATLLAPNDGYAWNNLGIVLSLKSKMVEASDCFRRAKSLLPEDASPREHLQIAETRLPPGQQSPNEDQRGLISGPDSAAAKVLSAVTAAEEEGRLQDAIDLCENLCVDRPEEVSVTLELNRLYQRAGDPQSGIDVLQAFLSRQPAASEVVAALGLARLDMGDHAAAERLIRQALEGASSLGGSAPFQLLLGLGDALRGQERFAEAHPWLTQAQELDPHNATVRIAVAVNLINMCRYEEGLELCLKFQAEGMRVPALGTVLAYLGQFEEAELVLDSFVRESPNDPILRFQRASLRLLHHDFKRGWEDYAYRAFSVSENFRVLPFPLWAGEPLRGKKVIVLAEQGLGDQVMFASCLPDLLREEPAEVVVEAIHRIAPTLQRSFPACRVIASSQTRRLEWLEDCPDMDFYVPLGDLPRYYRQNLSDFPAHKGFLSPDPGRVAYWKQQLSAAGPGPFIGFSWKGGTEGTRTSLRSVSPLDFLPLAQCREAHWVCLQYGAVEQAVAQAREGGFQMSYWPEAIVDLDEFAALVAALDLVITVCNTTVHYAGALGRPVWVLAPAVPEWRYGVTNGSLPWYPSSRVYRQTAAGSWAPVFGSVRQELSAWLAEIEA